jgi:hypothetical protein
MSDRAAIDRAMLARLTDAQLQALMPSGPYFTIAAKGAVAFVVVFLDTYDGRELFRGKAFETFTYGVKAVALDTAGTAIAAAEARIDALLQWHDGPPPFTIDGYDLCALSFIDRIKYVEVDAANADLRWQHAGGLYEVTVAEHPAPPARLTVGSEEGKDRTNGSTTWQ